LSDFPTRYRPSSLCFHFTVHSEPPDIAPFGQSVGRLCNRICNLSEAKPSRSQ